MKNLLIFAAGLGVGFGVSMIVLHKMIKKELAKTGVNAENTENLPFTFDNEPKEAEIIEEKAPVVTAIQSNGPVQPVEAPHTSYENMFDPSNIKVSEDENMVDAKESEPEPVGKDETDGGIHEIDLDEFMYNREYVQERLLYFPSESIMTTEEGAIIKGFEVLVGKNWEQNVGKFAKNTAFVRNEKLSNDYEITVMEGLYEEEFPDESNEME